MAQIPPLQWAKSAPAPPPADVGERLRSLAARQGMREVVRFDRQGFATVQITDEHGVRYAKRDTQQRLAETACLNELIREFGEW